MMATFKKLLHSTKDFIMMQADADGGAGSSTGRAEVKDMSHFRHPVTADGVNVFELALN